MSPQPLQSAPGAMGGSPPKRRKRDHYTLMACYSCKTRKVKCDGCNPCKGCQKWGALCSYPDRPGAAQQTLQPRPDVYKQCALPPTVEGLAPSVAPPDMGAGMEDSTSFSNILVTLPAPPTALEDIPNASPGTTTSTTGNASCDTGRSICEGGQGRDVKFALHQTNFAHAFNLARSLLEFKGVLRPETANTDNRKSLLSRFRLCSSSPDIDQATEPILDLGFEKAKCALSDFSRMIYPLYPCIDLSTAQKHLNYLFLDSIREMVNQEDLSEQNLITITSMDILKAVLGIAMLVNGNENAPLALHLPRYLDWSVENLIAGTGPEIDDIVMGMLMSIYFFYKSQLLKAWRMIGAASRACFELGLHQEASETPISANPPFLKILLCCVFVFDHQCAFATGLPYTMHLDDIHESRLDVASSAPYLSIMIDYGCVNSEIFSLVTLPARPGAKEQQLRCFLEFRLSSLVEKFDTLLSQADPDGPLDIRQDSQLLRNIKVSLSARVNHARNLLRIFQLQAAGGVQNDAESANIVTRAACETISLCSPLIKEATALNSLRTSFGFFICAALAAILLIVSQAPDIYGEKCRHAFHEALDILETSPFQLFTPRKLCFTFSQLRKIAERINMPREQTLPPQLFADDDHFWQSLGLSEPFPMENAQIFDDRTFGIFEMTGYL